MTRKDYLILAKVLAKSDKVIQKEALISSLCWELELDNPNFDSVKFRIACES